MSQINICTESLHFIEKRLRYIASTIPIEFRKRNHLGIYFVHKDPSIRTKFILKLLRAIDLIIRQYTNKIDIRTVCNLIAEIAPDIAPYIFRIYLVEISIREIVRELLETYKKD